VIKERWDKTGKDRGLQASPKYTGLEIKQETKKRMVINGKKD
jgi:hypothetical protein